MKPADKTDWQVLDFHRVLLRAERTGKGDGRVYMMAVTCRGVCASFYERHRASP